MQGSLLKCRRLGGFCSWTETKYVLENHAALVAENRKIYLLGASCEEGHDLGGGLFRRHL